MSSGRIRPPLGHDNGWWWEQVSHDRLVIQRCSGCAALRHPPRPMCDHCRSMEWDFVESSGQGTVVSYTVLHHPQFHGYQYPLTIVLVELDEGTRLTAELVDCPREQVDFGMAVTVAIHVDDDGFKIPVFHPSLGDA